MKYLVGDKEDFWKFVGAIGPEDKVGILTHTDLDGMASAIFLEEILKAKGIKIVLLDFMGYWKGVSDEATPSLEAKEINKLFVSDMCLESADKEGFERLRKKFDCFLIDHHPITEEISNTKNILKTESSTCAALIIYNLAKEIMDVGAWKLLICATLISEFSYNNPKNLEFIQKNYPRVTLANVRESYPGQEGIKFSSSLTYYASDLRKAYGLIKNQDIKEMEKIHSVIEKEINYWIKKFWKEAEFIPEKNLYFYYFNPKFKLTSTITTIVSLKHPEKIFVLASDGSKQGMMKVSVRNQGGLVDTGALMKKGVGGLKRASGGGHVKASAASFLKKDFEKFKKNILG